jgi:Zn-dependent protease
LGIPIYVHASWFIIFALITFSVTRQFAGGHPHWTPAQHWVAGGFTSMLFFGSVLFHELAHSVVALRYKIPVRSITLFVFGGLARIGREPERALQEFNVAVAGPLSSYFLAGSFYALSKIFPQSELAGALGSWLAMVNFGLATFNLVPGFPLDGGRMLRAMVWGLTRDYGRATRIASGTGQALAYAMILYGVWTALTGDFFGGLWLGFIGWFVLSAAQESYAQVTIRNYLRGLRAADVMTSDLPSVSRDISIDDYVQELLRTGRRCHLVTGANKLVGLVSAHSLNAIAREEWANTPIQRVMLPREHIHWAASDESLLSILERMQEHDINQMPVVREEEVLGLVTRDSILRVIQTRLELGLAKK